MAAQRRDNSDHTWISLSPSQNLWAIAILVEGELNTTKLWKLQVTVLLNTFEVTVVG